MEISDDYSSFIRTLFEHYQMRIKRRSKADQMRIRTAFEDLKQGLGKYKERLQYKRVYWSIRIISI